MKSLKDNIDQSNVITIKNIQSELINSIRHILMEIYVMDAKVVSVNKEKFIFVARDISNNHTIECATNLNDINNLNEDDEICLLGKLKLFEFDVGRLILNVELFFRKSEKDYMEEKILAYQQRKESLMNNKRQSIIEKIKRKKQPNFIRNTGIIVITSDSIGLIEFKEKFKENCKGKLVICHLNKNHIEKQFIYCLEYLKKYHYIDIVCVLADRLCTQMILALSSKDNIRYLCSRKKYPYIAYVSINNNHDQILNMLANINFSNVASCIEFISNIQSDFTKQLSHGKIQTGKMIKERIDEYEKRIRILSNTLTQKLFLLGVESSEKLLEKIKCGIYNKIDMLIEELHTKETILMRTLMNDENVCKYFDNSINENFFGPDLIPCMKNGSSVKVDPEQLNFLMNQTFGDTLTMDPGGLNPNIFSRGVIPIETSSGQLRNIPIENTELKTEGLVPEGENSSLMLKMVEFNSVELVPSGETLMANMISIPLEGTPRQNPLKESAL